VAQTVCSIALGDNALQIHHYNDAMVIKIAGLQKFTTI
jgi:hypothetical protein